MKKSKITALILIMAVMLTACSNTQTTQTTEQTTTAPQQTESTIPADAVEILLDDNGIKVDGTPADSDETKAVYVANDIVYYEAGKDFTYGEGTDNDAHSADEASAHTVVHITQPGTYSLSGTLSKGQIAVDLGDDAEENPDAVVNLILNGADITCDVAPAVIFYNVYECGTKDEKTASNDVDTSAAGANVYIADGTVNNVNGSYVARIYEADSVVLNDDGTEVEDAKKLHKYDGAFYSKMSMNINGGENGILNLNAANEGLGSELHLTINGGIININSGNDGINTNEDNISVTTVNGGKVNIKVTGTTGEGDGIDSNGWLVINGGTVLASACSDSADAGIDSDKGIHINGGTVVATGNMLDRIEDGGQTYAVFNFSGRQDGNTLVALKNESGETVMEHTPGNNYSIMIYSSQQLEAGEYTLWSGETQLGNSGGMGGFGMQGRPGMMPSGMERPERPEGMEKPENMEPPMGRPENEGKEPPAGEPPQMPQGGFRPQDNGGNGEVSEIFKISDGANMFGGAVPLK